MRACRASSGWWRWIKASAFNISITQNILSSSVLVALSSSFDRSLFLGAVEFSFCSSLWPFKVETLLLIVSSYITRINKKQTNRIELKKQVRGLVSKETVVLRRLRKEIRVLTFRALGLHSIRSADGLTKRQHSNRSTSARLPYQPFCSK